jgi:Zn-dependent protease with chaperone function
MMPAYLDAAASVVFSWLLTYAIHSTILLTLAAVAALRLADEHAWLDVIWKTALVAPLATASLHLGPTGLPLGRPWTMSSVTGTTGTPMVTGTAITVGETAAPAITDEHGAASSAVDRLAAIEKSAAGISKRFAWAEKMVRSWPSMVAVAWLIIAVAVLARYGIRLRRVYRSFASEPAVNATDLLDSVKALGRSANHRRPVLITTSAICPVPIALAGHHIVVPDRFLGELDPEQQRAALAHEMAHLLRRDPEWRIAIEILERVFFFQPLNRLARARLCDAAEFLSDEWAVRHAGSPLAMARCLSTVASWWFPADPVQRPVELAVGVSAMARSDSAMVRRVARILNEPARAAHRPRLLWLAIPVTLVAIAAPRVTATQLPVPVAATPSVTTAGAANVGKAQREWTAGDIAAARAKLRLHRSPRPGDPLEERWRQALADAARQRLTDFWIVYTFNTPIHADDVMMSDTEGGSFVSSNGGIASQGPPLAALFGSSAVPLEGGTVAVLMHYRGTRDYAIDRASYRTAQLGFDFGRTPVFSLGDAPEAQSFEQVKTLFDRTRGEKIQVLLIELASLHSNTDVVMPFLTRLVDPSWPPAIRIEAAEGFDHHHDPRSVEILLRVARTDPESRVRAEAAETIGEVQVPQSIAALNGLVSESADPAVRREAAEAFGAQPIERALPAIERIIATSEDDEVLTEVIEALGELGEAGALPLLVQTAKTHSHRRAQLEAVETLAEVHEPGVVDALTRIAWEHTDVTIQREAAETLGDKLPDEPALRALRDIIARHPEARVRREAEEQVRERHQ